jgi:hypothetical protein
MNLFCLTKTSKSLRPSVRWFLPRLSRRRPAAWKKSFGLPARACGASGRKAPSRQAGVCSIGWQLGRGCLKKQTRNRARAFAKVKAETRAGGRRPMLERVRQARRSEACRRRGQADGKGSRRKPIAGEPQGVDEWRAVPILVMEGYYIR